MRYIRVHTNKTTSSRNKPNQAELCKPDPLSAILVPTIRLPRPHAVPLPSQLGVFLATSALSLRLYRNISKKTTKKQKKKFNDKYRKVASIFEGSHIKETALRFPRCLPTGLTMTNRKKLLDSLKHKFSVDSSRCFSLIQVDSARSLVVLSPYAALRIAVYLGQAQDKEDLESTASALLGGLVITTTLSTCPELTLYGVAQCMWTFLRVASCQMSKRRWSHVDMRRRIVTVLSMLCSDFPLLSEALLDLEREDSWMSSSLPPSSHPSWTTLNRGIACLLSNIARDTVKCQEAVKQFFVIFGIPRIEIDQVSSVVHDAVGEPTNSEEPGEDGEVDEAGAIETRRKEQPQLYTPGCLVSWDGGSVNKATFFASKQIRSAFEWNLQDLADTIRIPAMARRYVKKERKRIEVELEDWIMYDDVDTEDEMMTEWANKQKEFEEMDEDWDGDDNKKKILRKRRLNHPRISLESSSFPRRIVRRQIMENRQAKLKEELAGEGTSRMSGGAEGKTTGRKKKRVTLYSPDVPRKRARKVKNALTEEELNILTSLDEPGQSLISVLDAWRGSGLMRRVVKAEDNNEEVFVDVEAVGNEEDENAAASLENMMRDEDKRGEDEFIMDDDVEEIHEIFEDDEGDDSLPPILSLPSSPVANAVFEPASFEGKTRPIGRRVSKSLGPPSLHSEVADANKTEKTSDRRVSAPPSLEEFDIDVVGDGPEGNEMMQGSGEAEEDSARTDVEKQLMKSAMERLRMSSFNLPQKWTNEEAE